MKKCIVYIGDFDFRNENVQSHLVKNNGKVLNAIGYHVEYIGVNRLESSFETVASLSPIKFGDGNHYLELPETLNMTGIFHVFRICRQIINKLNEIKEEYEISHIITYQSPTYAIAMKKIAKWCKRNKISYIVNCADLPTFDLQSPLRKIVMKWNWHYLHKINKKYANGVIAVSKFIAEFYDKPERASIIVPPLFDVAENVTPVKPNDMTTFIYAGTPFKITGHKASPDGMKDRLDKVIDYFLLLSEQGKNYKLNIVGISKEDYLVGVPRHAEPLENEGKIHFWGRRTHDQTLCMVAASDFSINYRDENLMTKAGFSTKIVESVSLGTPVIINAISDTFDYLEEGVSGFQLSGIEDEDTKIIKKLCELSPKQRIQLKEKVHNLKLFDTSRYQVKMASFLDSLK